MPLHKCHFLGLVLVCYSFLAPCTPLQTIPVENNEVWITVFIHGMMSIKHHLSLENIFRFAQDDIKGSTYEKTIYFMRKDPFFFKNQAMQAMGLQKIYKTPQPGNASGAMAILFDAMYTAAGSPNTNNLYYTFGWSGLLSPTARHEDAYLLYNGLIKEVQILRQKGFNPKIRLICYSHGGNVALNLAAVKHKCNNQNPSFIINELIVIGLPIQLDTDYLVNDPLFEKVYNFYSYADYVQPLDLFSFQRCFSERRFISRRGFEVSNKVKQIEIKAFRYRKYLNPMQISCASNLNNPRVLTGNNKLLRKMSPGHAELWFFGWTPLNYRSKFPLYPFPTISITPFIVQYLQQSNPCGSLFTLDIRPEYRTLIIKSKCPTRTVRIMTYLSAQQDQELRQKIEAFAPKNYTSKEYCQRLEMAFKYAYEWQDAQNLIQDQCSKKGR